jgi:hypothetical protein
MDCFEEFKYWYKRHWTYYRSQLLTDYVRVAYLLSPNPKVHADANENMEAEDKLAMERVLVKLFLPGYIEDNEVWERKKAPMVDELFSELKDFQQKLGYFKKMSIWIAAEDPNLPSYLWHQKYSLIFTKWLGKLACIVLSKMLGIGEAERIWKVNKQVRGGQRSRLTPEKTKKQSTIAAAHSLNKSLAKSAAMKRRGKLMDDKDFQALELGEFVCLLYCYVLAHFYCLTSTSIGYRSGGEFTGSTNRGSVQVQKLVRAVGDDAFQEGRKSVFQADCGAEVWGFAVQEAR